MNQIPTRVTGPATLVKDKRRGVMVYQTDAGPLTARQIQDITGLRSHKLWERYKSYGWQKKGILGLKRLDREVGDVVKEIPAELASIDFKALGDKQRPAKLKTIKLGSWELRNI